MASEYVSKSALKSEYGLTDTLIKLLGDADLVRPNPRYRSASPLQLYLRTRVERWVAENADLIANRNSLKTAARKAVETKRQSAREEIAILVKRLRMKALPERAKLVKQVSHFLMDRYWDWDGEVTEKAICSFIRHNYTNYEEILEKVKGKIGAGDLYLNVKVYLCCRIINTYHLNLEPLYAAFGEEGEFFGLPERFKGFIGEPVKLETQVATLLGIDNAENNFPIKPMTAQDAADT